MTATAASTSVVNSAELLDHWQGHRRLTRRVIDAFPEDKLFSFSISSMRPFSDMVIEFLLMTEPIVRGVATGKWQELKYKENPKTKAELLALWDETTENLNQLWPTIPPHRLRKAMRHSESGMHPASLPSSTRSITKSIIAARVMFICAHLASNRRLSTNAIKLNAEARRWPRRI